MKHTLYRITNDINGKFYIGVHSTKNLDDSYMGSGLILDNAIQKYGEENFTKETLAILPDRKTALDIEEFVVDKEMINRDDCYNINLGGKGGFDINLKGENNPMYGRNHTETTKNKISQKVNSWLRDNKPSMKGEIHSKESKKKMSKSQKKRFSTPEDHPMYGRKHTKETRKKMSEKSRKFHENNQHPLKGKSHSDETKEKISNAHKGKVLSEEHKKKISESCKGKGVGSDHPHSKEVRHIKTGKTFVSIMAASEWANLSRQSLGQHCKGNRDNQKFEFVN